MKVLFILLCFTYLISAQNDKGTQIARLKYGGGGDWYNDPSAEINLLEFIGKNTTIKVNPKYVFTDISSDDIFNYPILFLTGHGTIKFNSSEAERLKLYLERGGFLYVDDDYGLDKSFRKEIKKVFPEKELIELPFNFGMYNCFYNFESGPPKIHEHDNKAPQGFGIFIGKRLALYYTYESNVSDGWVDKEVHKDSDEVRNLALRFGTNMIIWALMN